MKKEQRERRENRKTEWVAVREERERGGGEKNRQRGLHLHNDSAAPRLPAALELERTWALPLGGGREEQRDEIRGQDRESNLGK